VILNTCHIREKASEKVYSELGRLRVAKDEAARNGRQMRIAVAGCVAQAEGAEIIRRAPTVDVVVGPQSYHHLPQLLARANSEGRALETEFPVEDKFGFLPAPRPAAIRARGISAFVTVQEGCDKFCTFCVVPYTRGAEVSRPVAKIVDDVKRLADNGVREITLIGQNVNAYHGEGPDGRTWPLGRLLHYLAEIEGIVRLRYSTSHPRDVDDSLIAAHRDLAALMPFVHLPVQSGSDRILAAMGPQMVDLAARRSLGTHPFLVTPDYCAKARSVIGKDNLLAPYVPVVLTRDRDEAHAAAGQWLSQFIGMPSYNSCLRAQGFTDVDLTDGPSERLIDAVTAWGDLDAIAARMRAFYDAGANHLALHVLASATEFPRREWRELASIADLR